MNNKEIDKDEGIEGPQSSQDDKLDGTSSDIKQAVYQMI